MTEMNPRKLADLHSAFENLGWKSDEILEALKTVKARPGVATIVMPKHYKEEAIQHAKNTAKIKKLKPGTRAYKNHFKKAYKEYLLDAWMNSRGVEIGDGGKASNPTTPKALAAYQTAVFGFGGSSFRNILDKIRDDAQKMRFERRLKGSVISLAHLWLLTVAGWDTNRVERPDLGISGLTTAFEFAKKTENRSAEEKERITREISLNNMVRGVLVTFIIKSIDRIFESDKDVIEKTLVNALADIPTDFLFWPLWREKFFDTLQYVTRKAHSHINYSSIIKETMRVLSDIGEAGPTPPSGTTPKKPPPPPSMETQLSDLEKEMRAAAVSGDIDKAADLVDTAIKKMENIPVTGGIKIVKKEEKELKQHLEKKTKSSPRKKKGWVDPELYKSLFGDWEENLKKEMEEKKKGKPSL